ncbi:hypothetical protein [Shewanella japonica]|uniref:hypothetical protein n=1 Tax=Shewanella japonica TaxID=93973 RepID=UPI000E728E07|nr:hypothetical protein [Shewanella japonica]
MTFSPLGDVIDNKWDGDVFNSWNANKTDIKVYSERFGVKGYAELDLIDGTGFYYKSSNDNDPSYFLSDCERIKKDNLPVYDWK